MLDRVTADPAPAAAASRPPWRALALAVAVALSIVAIEVAVILVGSEPPNDLRSLLMSPLLSSAAFGLALRHERFTQPGLVPSLLPFHAILAVVHVQGGSAIAQAEICHTFYASDPNLLHGLRVAVVAFFSPFNAPDVRLCCVLAAVAVSLTVTLFVAWARSLFSRGPKLWRVGAMGVGAAALAALLLYASWFAFIDRLFRFDDGDFATSVTNERLAREFADKRPVCEELRAMIETDRNLDVVGTSRIGPWTQLDHGWWCGDRRTPDVGEVLADAGLPASRYDDYLRRLDSIGASEIRRKGDQIRILVRREARFLRSATAEYVWVASGITPHGREPTPASPFHETFVALAPGWWLRDKFD